MGSYVVRSAILIFLAILAFATTRAHAQGTWLETRLINRDSPYEPPNQCEFLRFSGVLARQAVARTAAATWTVGNGG